MPALMALNRVLRRVGLPVRFGYDATADKGRRKAPTSQLRSEDNELTQSQRGKLVTSARDLRNFSIACWAIRKHLDYVSNFAFQAKTGDDGLDDALEAFVAEKSKPRAFDVAERHGRARMVRLAEAARTIDGDCLLSFLADGHTQLIESDRIRTPTDPRFAIPDNQSVIHGVLVNRYGKALGYCVHDRGDGTNVFRFGRVLDAGFTHHHAYWGRHDQVRGISPLSSALNTYRDLYEGLDYALSKAKVSQMFALAIYREAVQQLGEITDQTESATETDDEEGAEESPYKKRVNFGKGPIVLDLDPGDRAEIMESRTPSTEFVAFTSVEIAAALKALDIPFSFYDESFTNYSGSRGAWLGYDDSARQKRDDNRELLDRWTYWRVWHAVSAGDFALPRGMRVSDLRWEWISRGVPWIDPLKEIQADGAAVRFGLNSRQRILKERGLDFFEVADELASEQAYLVQKQVAVDMAPLPAQPNEPEQPSNGKQR